MAVRQRATVLCLGGGTTRVGLDQRHDAIAPAATQRGETLAIFTDQLTIDERVDLRGQEAWFELPPDPRVEPRSAHLRAVEP